MKDAGEIVKGLGLRLAREITKGTKITSDSPKDSDCADAATKLLPFLYAEPMEAVLREVGLVEVLEAGQAAITDAEKAVNPEARLYGYGKLNAAMTRLAGEGTQK